MPVLWLLQPDGGPGLAVPLRLPRGWRPPASLESGTGLCPRPALAPSAAYPGLGTGKVYLTDGEVAEREPRSLPGSASGGAASKPGQQT